MALSDSVMANVTTIYVALIFSIKAYGIISGRNLGAGFVLIISTLIVSFVLVGTLTWDVSRKVKYAIYRDRNAGGGGGTDSGHEMCKGGICWHGVAVRSPASQVRFRLPPPHPHHQPL